MKNVKRSNIGDTCNLSKKREGRKTHAAKLQKTTLPRRDAITGNEMTNDDVFHELTLYKFF